MDSTHFIAWWGAIVATTVLIWDVVKWARSTAIVRLVVRANTWYPDGEVIREKSTENGVSKEFKSYLHIELANVGSMPTTIMGIEAQKAWKGGAVGQSGPSFVPHYGNKLPYVLRPGEVWSCRADQDVLFRLPGQAPLELFVYLSHKAKPMRKRISTPTGQRQDPMSPTQNRQLKERVAMKKLIELNAQEAKEYFLKGSSYFNGDLPQYISFEPILTDVSNVLNGGHFAALKASNPELLSDVNYSFVANKDGRFAWRPYELMHPAIYVSLVNLICSTENWELISSRFSAFAQGSVTCCSLPVVSVDHQSDQAAQVSNWWQEVEQKSLCYSLEFSHVLHTDVTDCYGSLYTHSIAWALHGLEVAKQSKGKDGLLGDKVDASIRAGRYGQTNGISQGSVLMDFIAELVLGYVDELISRRLGTPTDFRILRYRDDYRIFTNSDVRAEEILKIVSDELRTVGMRLGVSKTFVCTNVVEGSIKPDKLAGIDLQDLGDANAKTIQKQLLRLHSFGKKYPNSGALRRLVGELHTKIVSQKTLPEDLEVQVAIATDIAVVSPLTFPAIAGILSHLISLQEAKTKGALWSKVHQKMSKVPYNGYLQVWLQRVTKPKAVGINYHSDEPICKIVNGEVVDLWNNTWISSTDLKNALQASKLIVKNASETPEVMQPSEVELFNKNASLY